MAFPMNEGVLSLTSVKEVTSLGRTSIYDGIKNGEFPKPIKLGARRVGFLESGIAAWIAAKAGGPAVP